VHRNYKSEIAYTYRDIPELWDSLLPAGHNLQRHSLSIIERAHIEDIRPLYISVYQQHKLVAVIYAQVLEMRARYINTENTYLRNCGKGLVELFKPRLLTIGNLFRHDGTYVYFSPHVKDQDTLFHSVVHDIIDKINPTAYFLKDIPYELQLPFSSNPRYNRFANDVSMELDIWESWQNFNDYISCLTKKYKQRAIKTRAVFSDVEVRTLSLEEVIQHQKAIHELYLQVAMNQSVTLGLLNQEYFSNFKEQMKDRLEVLGFFHNGKMLAFGSAILTDEHYDMNYIGFDYEANSKMQLYFNMLFSFLERSILLRKKKLLLGRTALEAKAILGATPKNVYSFYRIKNSILNYCTTYTARRLAADQGTQWQNRHPFLKA
jgi:hypothetical protein